MAKRPKIDPSQFLARPANVAIIKLLARRSGATVAEITKARKLVDHTVRGAISRLGSVGKLEIARTYVKGRGHVYKLARGAR